MKAPRATIDFETRSACSLKKCGPWKYSLHPSTEILCLAWRLPSWPAGRTALWYPSIGGIPEHFDAEAIQELTTWIESGGLVEAHNVWFELCIWQHILSPQYGWPSIPLTSWRCSAAKAAVHALPRGLDESIKALQLPVSKDLEGSKVMMKMTKPRRSRKAERAQWAKDDVKPPRYLWWETPDLFDQLVQYCRQDVLAEAGLSDSLADLSPNELQVFQLDLQMNVTGFQLDRPAVRAALRLIKQETKILNAELSQITNKQVRRATQRARMIAWFAQQGLTLVDTQKATLDELIRTQGASVGTSLSPTVTRAIEIVRALGRSSTAKYQAMLAWMAKDSRVHGGLLYHGASTGRWAGKGVQPHNFPKGSQKVDMEALWTTLKTEDRTAIAKDYRSVMEALSNGLRGAIVARPHHELYVADYAAIEARVVLWLADDQEALEIFRTGQDIYLRMASEIYGYPCTKSEHPDERALGKIAVLGLGYQMGASKFVATCEAAGIIIEEPFAVYIVDTYRTQFWRVKQMWWDQEEAARLTVETKQPHPCGQVTWVMSGRFLQCILPSGRRLSYPFPKIQPHRTSWGADKMALTYMGLDSYTHQWKRLPTYGGMLVENITQAVARDIMAEAMLRTRKTPYRVILSVHDELIAEARAGQGSVDEFVSLLTECPHWASDCPINAEGWVGPRYHK